MEQIDFNAVNACVERSLELLRHTFRRGNSSDVGGWYHSLDSDMPGPSATGVGLSSFLVHGRPFEHREHCLRFLRERQIQSDDPVADGGWAVNTSFGQPVTEATALVSRLLVVTRTLLTAGAPDAGRASRWLIHNQNDDGGWGSFHGQQSRIWLTAMTVRALSELDPFSPALRRGADWLVQARDSATQGWGERRGQPATVTHTSYVLTALVDSGLGATHRAVADAIEEGYRWLARHLDPRTIHDDRARVESYNVTRIGSDGRPVTWHSTVWHHGLPFAVSALVRQPAADHLDLLYRAVNTMTRTQMEDGRWPSADSAAAFSVWTVWPFLEALADVTAITPMRRHDLLTAVTAEAAVIQRGADRNVPLWRLLGAAQWRAGRRWLATHWAVLVLALFITIGGVLVLVAGLRWQEFGMGMGVPVVLLLIQEAMVKGRFRR